VTDWQEAEVSSPGRTPARPSAPIAELKIELRLIIHGGGRFPSEIGLVIFTSVLILLCGMEGTVKLLGVGRDEDVVEHGGGSGWAVSWWCQLATGTPTISFQVVNRVVMACDEDVYRILSTPGQASLGR
jgi:hypothetical protein